MLLDAMGGLWRLEPGISTLSLFVDGTLFTHHPDLFISDDRVQNVEYSKLWDVTLDRQLTFEKHYCTKMF